MRDMKPNFSVEQSARKVGGAKFEQLIKSKFKMDNAPTMNHPITNSEITPDAMLTLWGKPVIFEITKSAEKLKAAFIEMTNGVLKRKYSDCLYVVILERVKAPRKSDKLDSVYDDLNKLVDYVLIGEDEVTQFINSPIQPINYYKLKLQKEMNNIPNTENSIKLMMAHAYSLETINQFMSFAHGSAIQVIVKNKTSVKKTALTQQNIVLQTLENNSKEQFDIPSGWVAVHTLFNKTSTYGLKELGKVTFDKWIQQNKPQFVKVKNHRGNFCYYTNVSSK
jgi:hypothetical protein